MAINPIVLQQLLDRSRGQNIMSPPLLSTPTLQPPAPQADDGDADEEATKGFLAQLLQVAQRPNPYDATLQNIVDKTPAMRAQEIFNERYAIKGRGKKNAVITSLAEGMKALGQGGRYVNRQERARREADADLKEQFARALEAKKATDVASNHEIQGLIRGMGAEIQGRRADTYKQQVEAYADYHKKMNELQEKRLNGQLDEASFRNEVRAAQASLAMKRGQFVEAQTQGAKVKAENDKANGGLGGAFGAANRMGTMDPGQKEDFVKNLGEVQTELKKSKFAPVGGGGAQFGGWLQSSLVDKNAEFWNPKTRQIETIPAGPMYRRGSGEAFMLGPQGRTKLTGNTKLAITKGRSAETTLKSATTILAEAIASGEADKFVHPIYGMNTFSLLRQKGFTNEFNLSEAQLNALNPTATLQHLNQLVGGQVSDEKMRHFQNSIGIERATTKRAKLYNTVGLQLTTEHLNDVMGGVVSPDSYTNDDIHKIKKTIKEYVDKVMTVAETNKKLRKAGLPLLSPPERPNLNDIVGLSPAPNQSYEFSPRPLPPVK